MSTTELFFEISDELFQLESKLGSMMLSLSVSIIFISIYCFIIMRNQRKIKKMLRQMQEQKQDKPQE